MPPKGIAVLKKPVKAIPKLAPPTGKAESVKTAPESSHAFTSDWVNVGKGVAVCSGSYSQSHKKFKGNNEQGAAVCVAACVFSDFTKTNLWNRALLDVILGVGTSLYLKTRQNPDNRCQSKVTPDLVYKYFFLDDMRISSRVGTDVTTSRVPRDINILDHIDELLKSFFARHQSGVLTYMDTYFAVWRMDRYYFLFDPRDNDRTGKKWQGLPGLGYCYCMKSPSTKVLAQVILDNIPLRAVYKFTVHPVAMEKAVKINTVPPKTLEEAVTPVPLKVEQPIKKKPPPVKKALPVKALKTRTVPPAAPSSQTQMEVVPKKVPSMARIPPLRPRLASVTNFVEVQPGEIGILRASTHQADPRFTKYQGVQSLSNAVAALTMLRQHKAKAWVRTTVDEILKLGEVVHAASKDLHYGQVTSKVTLNEKDYSPKLEMFGAVGRLLSDQDEVLSLLEALSNFLLDNDCCVVFGPVVLAVWKEDRRYYMFDPNERDALGRRPKEAPGVACVTWFIKIADLVALYMANVPRDRHKEKFLLARVKIKDWVPVPEDWYNFKALTFNRWILRGHFSQQDRRFPVESRNAQCTANATMALTYKELKTEQEWDSSVVDQVLISGDEFYRGCVDHLKEVNKFKDRYLMVDELKRTFDVENKRVNLEIDDCLVNGILNAKSDTGIPNLRKGFEEFFSGNDAGIVTANLQSMAVWRRDETFYYYDSHSRDEKGIVCGHGTACILRLVNIDDLATALLSNMGAGRENFFNISRIVVHLIDLTEDGVVKPPLQNYEEVSELVAILRASFSERDPKYHINAGKQTVPMAVAAVAMNSLIPSSDWALQEVNQVLAVGDKLYAESMADNYKEDVPEELNVDDISTENMKKRLVIGTNVFQVEFEGVAQGNVEDNLEEAITTYYQGSQEAEGGPFQALLDSQFMTVTMWKDDNSIYLFDPRPRDAKGDVYGKEDWMVEQPPPEGQVDEEEEEDEVEKEEEVVETDEMAGGDNFGIRISDVELPKSEVVYETSPELDEDEDEEQSGEMREEEANPVKEDRTDYWRAKEDEEGKACVLRFSKIEDLIQHLVDNTPTPVRKEVDFTLKTIQLENVPITHAIHDPEQPKEEEFVGDWNEFKEVDYGRWILRASRNLHNQLFPECNRGRQQLPMSIMALIFVNVFDVERYNTEVLDKLLVYGDRFHTTARKIKFKEMKSNRELGLSDEEIELILHDLVYRLEDYPRKLCMGQHQATWQVTPEAVVGDTSSKNPEEVLDLQTGLETFFTEHGYGVLHCRDYAVAVWKSGEMFFMFDPHPTGPSGSKSPMGTASMTRYRNLEDLVKTYLSCLPSIGDHFFEVHGFAFEQSECPRERQVVEVPEKPPQVGGFIPVTSGKYILRGSSKLDSGSFSRGVHVHSAAIAMAALSISQTVEANTWTRILVDEVLSIGRDLHQATLQRLGDRFNPWEESMDIYRLNSDFRVGSLRANSALRYTEVRGVVDVKMSKTPNLRQGLERFFVEDSHGVLLADKFMLAVWEEGCSIYMFDPNSRGVTGLPSQGGVACLMKFCNAKEVADHVMACMVGVDKTKTQFALVPVEIVLADSKTRKRLPSKMKRKPCECKEAERSTYRDEKMPSKAVSCKEAEMEAKRVMRKIAEERRKAEEARRLALLGRNEYHQMAPGQYILRGFRSMTKGRDLPINIAAFVYMKVTTDLDKWTHKQVDLILETGDQLHVDSCNAYKLQTDKLNLHQVLRRVLVKDQEVRIGIKKPILGSPFTRENLMRDLDCFFTKANFCLLSYLDYLVAVYFKSGYFYLFDPYNRDVNGNTADKGTAVMMRFDTMTDLVEKLVTNLGDAGEVMVSRYVLIVLVITEVQPLLIQL